MARIYTEIQAISSLSAALFGGMYEKRNEAIES
jgi:hypothetical protein